jgi:hypothetical protein
LRNTRLAPLCSLSGSWITMLPLSHISSKIPSAMTYDIVQTERPSPELVQWCLDFQHPKLFSLYITQTLIFGYRNREWANIPSGFNVYFLKPLKPLWLALANTMWLIKCKWNELCAFLCKASRTSSWVPLSVPLPLPYLRHTFLW